MKTFLPLGVTLLAFFLITEASGQPGSMVFSSTNWEWTACANPSLCNGDGFLPSEDAEITIYWDDQCGEVTLNFSAFGFNSAQVDPDLSGFSWCEDCAGDPTCSYDLIDPPGGTNSLAVLTGNDWTFAYDGAPFSLEIRFLLIDPLAGACVGTLLLEPIELECPCNDFWEPIDNEFQPNVAVSAISIDCSFDLCSSETSCTFQGQIDHLILSDGTPVNAGDYNITRVEWYVVDFCPDQDLDITNNIILDPNVMPVAENDEPFTIVGEVDLTYLVGVVIIDDYCVLGGCVPISCSPFAGECTGVDGSRLQTRYQLLDCACVDGIQECTYKLRVKENVNPELEIEITEAEWFQVDPNGDIPIGNGPIINHVITEDQSLVQVYALVAYNVNGSPCQQATNPLFLTCNADLCFPECEFPVVPTFDFELDACATGDCPTGCQFRLTPLYDLPVCPEEITWRQYEFVPDGNGSTLIIESDLPGFWQGNDFITCIAPWAQVQVQYFLELPVENCATLSVSRWITCNDLTCLPESCEPSLTLECFGLISAEQCGFYIHYSGCDENDPVIYPINDNLYTYQLTVYEFHPDGTILEIPDPVGNYFGAFSYPYYGSTGLGYKARLQVFYNDDGNSTLVLNLVSPGQFTCEDCPWQWPELDLSGPIVPPDGCRVYPNPSSGSVQVFHFSNYPEQELRIFDAKGQLQYNRQLSEGANHTEVDLRHLPAGIYFLIIEQKGEIRHTQRLILE